MHPSSATVRTITLAAVAMLAMAIGIAACGDSNDSTTTTSPTPSSSPSASMPQAGDPSGDLGAMLSTLLEPLVEDGTISATQQESVLAALEDTMSSASSASPSAGSEQAEATGEPSDLRAMFATALGPLVADGSITAAQKRAIMKSLAVVSSMGSSTESP